MDPNQQSADAIEKQKQFFERARRGVLQYLSDKGGKLSMGELHDYSTRKYLIQHQRFSQMMETFVNENLVEFDWGTQDTVITEAGRQFLAQSPA